MKANTTMPLDLRSDQGLTLEADQAVAWEPFMERFRHVWRIMPASVKKAIREHVEAEAAHVHDHAARTVLEFMNAKRPASKSGFKPVEANLRLIRARLREGFSVDELRAIVAVKWRQVEAGQFPEQYFRPGTLFRAEKCAQYAGELGAAR